MPCENTEIRTSMKQEQDAKKKGTFSMRYVSYLLLHDKLPQNLATYKKYLLYHSFCGSRIWE